MGGTWFECKVVYTQEDSKGKRKKVTESHLVEAFNFADAEERVGVHVAPFITGDFIVMGIRKAAINELWPNDEGDKLYKCKVNYISIDEVSAKERKVSTTVMVFGRDLFNAVENLIKHNSDSVSDYEIASVVETPILDIIPKEVDDEEEEKDDTKAIYGQIGEIKDELDAIEREGRKLEAEEALIKRG